MKILKSVLYVVALVIGIVVASANMGPVVFTWRPVLGTFGGEGAGPGQVELPLALLLLGFLLAGALVAGTGTLVEHVRLRFRVRRSAKEAKALRAEVERARTALAEKDTRLSEREAELAEAKARATRAEEAAARAGEAAARATALADEERSRAQQEHRLAPPPGA